MKNKFIFSSLSIMLLSVFVTGCSDSPTDVAESWRDAIIQEDLKLANEYSSDTAKLANIKFIESFYTEGKKAKVHFKKDINKILENEPEIVDDTALFDCDFILSKVDGDWKVDLPGDYNLDGNEKSKTIPVAIETVPAVAIELSTDEIKEAVK